MANLINARTRDGRLRHPHAARRRQPRGRRRRRDRRGRPQRRRQVHAAAGADRAREPDSGRVTHTSGLSVGYLRQSRRLRRRPPSATVIVGGRPDHIWAAEPDTRGVVEHLLAEVDLDADVADLSGGERRRVALAAVLIAGHDVLVLDEPTNHLDVEVIGWLAGHLTRACGRRRWWWSATTAGSSTRSHQHVGGARRRRRRLRRRLRRIRAGPRRADAAGCRHGGRGAGT